MGNAVIRRSLVRDALSASLARAITIWSRLAVTVFPVVFVVWAWVAGNGVPYFMDSNESVLSYVHAVNLWRFPVRDTVLLTIEDTEPVVDGPRMVYTHNPNLPRLLHAALLAVGILPLPLHILTIGVTATLASMLLLQSLSRRLAGSAAVGLALPLTLALDSTGFLTWTVNTYRVMSFVLLWAALLSVVARPPSWASFLTGFALSYFEYGFALFAATAVVTLGTLRLGRRAWRPLLPFILGAVASLAVFGAQVVGYFGVAGAWDELLRTVDRRGMRHGFEVVSPSVVFYTRERYGAVILWLVTWSLVTAPLVLLPSVRRRLTPWRLGLAQLQIGLLLGCLATATLLRDYFLDGYILYFLPCLVFPIAVGVTTAAVDVATFLSIVVRQSAAPLAFVAVALAMLPNFGRVFEHYPQLAPELPPILSREFAGAPFVAHFVGAYLAFALTGAPAAQTPETTSDVAPYERLRGPDGRLYYLCFDFVERGKTCDRAVNVYGSAGHRLVHRGREWAILELHQTGVGASP